MAPLGYGFRRDDVNYVVFCFAKLGDVRAFCRRFGGERLCPRLTMPPDLRSLRADRC